jgi:hypothetical protein
MIIAQKGHDLFRFRPFSKGGKAAQITKHNHNIAAVTFENAFVAL